MAQNRLTKAVMRRLKELGLPSSILDVGEFRNRFFNDGWVMYVRDRDKIADVHLIETQPGSGPKPVQSQRPRLRAGKVD